MIWLLLYFALFVCVLATLHSPGSSTHKIWEDAVNYSYISAGNLILLASQVAINTLIFSLLTVLYFYALINNVERTVNINQHQDTSISGRRPGYGSTMIKYVLQTKLHLCFMYSIMKLQLL